MSYNSPYHRSHQVHVDYSDADLDSMDDEFDDIVQSLKAQELRETNSTLLTSFPSPWGRPHLSPRTMGSLTKQITTSGNTVQLQQQMSHLRQENTKSQSILRNE
eukprot:771734_1